MVDVKRQKRHLSPTTRWVNEEGRLTKDGFSLMKDFSEFISLIAIEDGEIKMEMLEAQIIRVSTLFADEVVITSKVKPNAISELSALIQPGSASPNGSMILVGTVPISSTNNTGLMLTFTGFMDKPTPDPSNVGYWSIQLNRNGVEIGSTPPLFYDDNFSYQPVATFIDENPGTNPEYSLTTTLHGGLGNFVITNSVLNVGLLKR